MPVQTPAAVSAPTPEPPAHADLAAPNTPRPAPTKPLERGPAAATDDAGSAPLDELLAQSGRWYWTARNNTKSEQIWLCPDQTARYESEREKLAGRYVRTGTKLTLRFGKKQKQATLSSDAKLLTLADKTALGFVKTVDCGPTQ